MRKARSLGALKSEELMPDKWWQRPVIVYLPDGGQQTITCAREAFDLLWLRWPERDGPLHEQALQACLHVSKGRRVPEWARDALVEACEEARLVFTA